MNGKVKSIDEYIQRYPVEVQQKLEKIRSLIHEVAPLAQEKISYQTICILLPNSCLTVPKVSIFHCDLTVGSQCWHSEKFEKKQWKIFQPLLTARLVRFCALCLEEGLHSSSG